MFRHFWIQSAFAVTALVGGNAFAEPTTGTVKVIEVRPYNVPGAPGSVYVRIDQASVCSTDTYRIDLTYNGSKEIVATVLAAFVADKPVKVEVVGALCNGFGTPIQSLYIVKQ